MPIQLDLKTKFQRTLDSGKQVLSGRLICRQLTYIVDAALIWLFHQIEKEVDIHDRICIIPVGGYGRMEIAPYSDVDLLYLHDGLDEKTLEIVISKLNYFLYDSGKEVGHSCRTIQECKEYLDNFHSFNAYLDSRFLIGSEELYTKYVNEFLNQLPKDLVEDYNNSKLSKLQKIIDSEEPLLLTEPNLKTDPCFLRDVQRIYWLEKSIKKISSLSGLGIIPVFCKGEVQQLENAYDFFLKVRTALHALQGKKGDRLALTLQPEVAEYLNFGPKTDISSIDMLMNELYRKQKDIYFFIGMYLDYKKSNNKKMKTQYFPKAHLSLEILEEKYLFPPRLGNLFSRPETLHIDIMNIFFLCQRHDLELSYTLINELRFISYFLGDDFINSKISAEIFLNILKEKKRVGKILTIMHDCNVLGKFIPEFGACTYFPLFSYHHQYTVDEHSLYILRELDKLIEGDYDDIEVQEEFNQCEDIHILILSILIHDAGKVKEGDHCQYGAELAYSIGERIGLTEYENGLFYFLVERHIDMSELSTKRDISDPNLIRDFARQMRNEHRLRLLYVFTIIDTKSVGPGILTNWKKAILETLFTNTLDFFRKEKEESYKHTTNVSNLDFLRHFLLHKEYLPKDEVEEIIAYSLNVIPSNYLSYSTPRRIFHHYQIYKAFMEGRAISPIIEFESEAAYMIMNVYDKYNKFILSDISGTVSSESLNLIGLRSFRNKNGFVINQVQVTDSYGSGKISDEKKERLKEKLSKVLQKQTTVDDLISTSLIWDTGLKKIPEGMVEELVEFKNDLFPEYTVIEVRLPDSLGLLYRILKQILSFDIQLDYVRVVTSADFAYDSFYVKSTDGFQIVDERLQQEIKNKIMQAKDEGHKKESIPYLHF